MMVSERLDLMLKRLDITQTQFANDMGIEQGTVSDIIRGKTKGLSKTIAKLSAYKYNINPTWLLMGEDEMFMPDSDSPSINLNPKELKIIKAYREKVEIQPAIDKLLDIKEESDEVRQEKTMTVAEGKKEYFIKKNVESESILENVVKERNSSYKTKPAQPPEIMLHYLGQIAAGIPVLAEQSDAGELIPVPTERLPKRINDKNSYVVGVSGMSMMDANILDGDRVVIEKIASRSQIKNGDIIAALINNESTLKRAIFTPNGIELIELRPENVNFKPIYLDDENDSVEVQGRWVLTLWASRFE